MSSSSQTARFSAPNSTFMYDCDAVENDIRNNQHSLDLSLNSIDEPLRTLPDTIEILIIEKRPDDLKKVLTLSSGITKDSEVFHKEKERLDTRLENLLVSRPKKKSRLSDHYVKCVQLGSDYIELNGRIINTAGELVQQLTDVLERPNPESVTAPKTEVQS